MERELQKRIVEALLFLKEDSLKIEYIADFLAVSPDEARGLVEELQQDLAAANRGVRLYEAARGYRMGTPPELATYLERAFSEEGAGNLSSAALETLAIIAYKQPVTRVEMESIRGVKCDHVLDNLLRRKLIRVSGRKEGPGRPLLYSTTTEFLKYFGIKELRDLPPLAAE